jgi:hypothetical protein
MAEGITREAEERAAIRAEFEELQRQYKHMEAMKKVRPIGSTGQQGDFPPTSCLQAYADESLGIIKKQKELIEKLQSDNSVRSG